MTEPVRTCVGCGRKAPQSELARFAAPDGTLVADRKRRLSGRGAYTCRSAACFERARARRAFARTLRRAVAVPAGLNALLDEG
ncbi:MAG: DUF448 domain-containing protein [Actinobacteria bacterium]|nr:DUF448 domain-containing protein [Actinomycetota bacterium]